MNNLTKFTTTEEYNIFVNSTECPIINTSYITSENKVEYLNDIQEADSEPFTIEFLNTDEPMNISFICKGQQGTYRIKYKINDNDWQVSEQSIGTAWQDTAGMWINDLNLTTGDKISLIIEYDQHPLAAVERFFVDQNISNLEVKLSGNIMSLYSGDYTVITPQDIYEANKEHIDTFRLQWDDSCSNLIQDYQHNGEQTYLRDIDDLVLPRHGLTPNIFQCLFKNCTYITTACPIKAKGLPSSACYEMFNNCTSLTDMPVIEARTISDSSCFNMFYNCTSLVNTTPLHINRIVANKDGYAGNCTWQMFMLCESLVTAPVWNETLFCETTNQSSGILYHMFDSCTRLEDASPIHLTIVSPDDWRTDRGNFMDNMYNMCSSLVDGPFIEATHVNNFSFSDMFNGCDNLESITYLSPVSPNFGDMSGNEKNGTFYYLDGVDYNPADFVPATWTCTVYTEPNNS